MFLLKPEKGNKPETEAKFGPVTIRGKRTITEDEKRELLVGYITVPPEKWDTIPYKSHIRYVKDDGTFVRGGFFKNYWKGKDETQMMQLENNLNRKTQGYATWAVALTGVKTIYKKVGKAQAIEVGNVYQKLEVQRRTINSLVDAINKLDRRVRVLEGK